MVWHFAIRTHNECSAVLKATRTNALLSKASNDKTSCDKRSHELKHPTVQKRFTEAYMTKRPADKTKTSYSQNV